MSQILENLRSQIADKLIEIEEECIPDGYRLTLVCRSNEDIIVSNDDLYLADIIVSNDDLYLAARAIDSLAERTAGGKDRVNVALSIV